MTADSEDLHEIANTTNPDREADIVFVHGLGGASHSTWRYGTEGKPGHFFWPEEFGKNLPKCGIWTVGYPAGFTALGKPGMIIEKRAGNLSQKLANAGLGVRPLMFITHSMGGLVVKSLIVGSQTLADADRKRLVSAIRCLVFCATPHRGSAFADAAGVLGKFFGGSQDHVDQMRANAEPLDILHDQFIEWHRINQIPVDSYAENIGLFRKDWLGRLMPLGLVVPRASANPGIAGHTVRDVDDDHLSLVKPSDRSHDVYAGVLRFVRDALARLAPPPPKEPVPPEAASELISPQEFTDDKVRSAAIVLNQTRADKSLTMRTLIGILDGLFDRNTFRREPSVGQCVTKEWDIRLHSALQTLRLLDDYAPFVKTEARSSWELYRELTAEVSRYGERMAALLFDPPVGLAGLRNLVGTEGFIHAIQKHTVRFQGANVKAALETCKIIDPHLKKAIDLMDTLQDEFCGPVNSSEEKPTPINLPESAAPLISPTVRRPRIYISYTWREKLGEDRALKLANQLRAAGMDARIDRYYRESLHGFTPPPLIRLGEDAWTRWQEEQICDADRVLLICGPEYANSPPDSGVARDLRFMEEDLKRPGVELRKFVPVGFAHYVQNKQNIPQFLHGANYYNLGPGSKIGRLKDLIRHFGNEFPLQVRAALVQDTTALPRYPDSTPTAKDITRSKKKSKQPTLSMQPPVDFVIITPLEEERESMLRHLGDPKRLPPTHDDIRVYYPATVSVTFTDDSTGSYKIVITEPSGMGHVDSANVVGDAIRRWQPRYILVVGIAGGLAKAGVNVGDVLIGDQIADYELQKLTPEKDYIRWSVHRADPRLLTAAKQLRPEEWRSLVCVARPESGQPQRHTGPICTGNKVIANGLMDQYRDVWTKLIGVEMEAGGVASAALQAANAPGFFMVRGVSDLADAEKDKPQVHSWRSYACDVAAAYVMAFLKSGPVPANPK